MKILMVCLGNICRSPLAEGIMREKIKQHGLDWEVDSAGTGSWHVGNEPDHRSIAVGLDNGIDIRSQRGRQISKEDLDTFDLIFVMDSSNYQNVQRLVFRKEQKDKIEMIMNLVQPGYNQSVPDPYYGDDGFVDVYEMLDTACDHLVKKYSDSER